MEQVFEETRERRYQELLDNLAENSSIAIAFSGGIDSTFLAKAAIDSLGRNNVLALTSNSAIFPLKTINYANNAADFLGIEHHLLDTDELSDDNIVKNGTDHCYYCKNNMISKFLDLAKSQGVEQLADGTNHDDANGQTPAPRVAEEHGTLQPLAALGFTKMEVRNLSRWLGLPMWNREPELCLISRVTLDIPITAHLLAKIQAAEFWLTEQGFNAPIVRVEIDHLARINVDSDEFDLFADEKKKTRTVAMFKELGFEKIALDLEGTGRTLGGFTR